MKRILLLLICTCLILTTNPNVWAQSSIANLDPHLFNWLKLSVSSFIRLPFNFYLPKSGYATHIIDPRLLNWISSMSVPLPIFLIVFTSLKRTGPKFTAGWNLPALSRVPLRGRSRMKGMDIYDGAVYQIVLSMAGGQENLDQPLCWIIITGRDLWGIPGTYARVIPSIPLCMTLKTLKK